jgi:hypothetical protein
MAPQIAPSDLFPAVLRFLTETGLTKSAVKFQKETGVDADAAASLPKLEELYASWMATKGANGTALNGKSNGEISVGSEVLSKKEKKKKQKAQSAIEAVVENEVVEEVPAEEEAPKKKKRKKSMDAEEEAAPEEAPKKKKAKKVAEEPAAEEPEPTEPAEEEAAPEKKKKKKKDDADAEKVKGEVFQRVDDAAWRAKIKDSRLLDNTHKAKAKFGVYVDTGDSWADKASEDLLKVKGKDFRKEMMKKKKASWKGGGSLDQGVNSIPFSDSDDG